LVELNDERIERLLAALLIQTMKNATLKEKIEQLNIVGFSNLEIAELLKTSPQIVAQRLYETRMKPRSKRKK